MKKRVAVLSAIALVVNSLPAAAALEDDFEPEVLERCESYNEWDRNALQLELEELLQDKPDDLCIPYIVALLGAPPLALAAEGDDGGDAVVGGGGGGEIYPG